MDLKAQKVSDDGVFFRCSICKYEPEMASKTDDLLKMNFCPNCGNEFYNVITQEMEIRDLTELRYDFIVELIRILIGKHKSREIKSLSQIIAITKSNAAFIQDITYVFDETIWLPDNPNAHKDLIQFNVQLRGQMEIMSFRYYLSKGANQSPIYYNNSKQNWSAVLSPKEEQHKSESIDQKAQRLMELTMQFIFTEHYTHTGVPMYKIINPFTDLKEDKVVLCPTHEGIEKALDLAYIEIQKRKTEFYEK